ncbi:hypothetical protein [Mesorhizobium amorphae]|uniref:hypothetical protein n=1 Tax=Mesorhizobium amorphae TaxID=71433 RepID=UPI00177B24C0|nr:hypothetical protein [Mesorhizobium amorphae]
MRRQIADGLALADIEINTMQPGHAAERRRHTGKPDGWAASAPLASENGAWSAPFWCA